MTRPRRLRENAAQHGRPFMASPSHSTSSGLEISATTSGGSLGNRFLLPWSAPRNSARRWWSQFREQGIVNSKTDAFSCQRKYSGSAILELSDQPGTGVRAEVYLEVGSWRIGWFD